MAVGGALGPGGALFGGVVAPGASEVNVVAAAAAANVKRAPKPYSVNTRQERDRLQGGAYEWRAVSVSLVFDECVNFFNQNQKETSSQAERRSFQAYVRQCAAIVATNNKAQTDVQWVPNNHPFNALFDFFKQNINPAGVSIQQWCHEAQCGVAPKAEGVPSFWIFHRNGNAGEAPVVRLVTGTRQSGTVSPVTFTRNSLATVVAVVLREVARDSEARMIAKELLEVQHKKAGNVSIGSLSDLDRMWETWPKDTSKPLCKALAFAALQWEKAIGRKALQRMDGDIYVQYGGGKTRYGTNISLSEGKKRDRQLEEASRRAVGDSGQTTYVGWDGGVKQYTLGGPTRRLAEIITRRLTGKAVSEEEQLEAENAKTHLGLRYINANYADNIHQTRKDEKERARDLKIFIRCLVDGEETFRKIIGRKDFADCSSEAEVLATIKIERIVGVFRLFAFASSRWTQWIRRREIARERFTGVLSHAVSTQLPDALNAAPSVSLERNLPTPPITAAKRRKQQRVPKQESKLPRPKAVVPKEKEEADEPKEAAVPKQESKLPRPKAVVPKEKEEADEQQRKEEADSESTAVKPGQPLCPPRLVRVAIDPVNGKGRKNTSRFAYVEELERLKRLVRRHERLRKTLVLHEVDSHRSTIQAQPTRALWMGEEGRMDRTSARPEDIPSTWVGSVPNSFKILVDPLLGTLVNRDSNVPVALAMIDIALHHGVERPNIFCRFSKARTTSGGGVESHI
jgi:hypothetical protein